MAFATMMAVSVGLYHDLVQVMQDMTAAWDKLCEAHPNLAYFVTCL